VSSSSRSPPDTSARTADRHALVGRMPGAALIMTREFEHGDEPRAEEIALHQRFLTLLGQMEAAQAEGNASEVRRLGLPLERARKRWLRANVRVTRGE
jgi:hypothetical protein